MKQLTKKTKSHHRPMTGYICALIAITLCIGLAGCNSSSAYLTINSEDEIVSLAQLKDQWVSRPTTTTRIATYIGDGPPVNIAVHETGNLQSDKVIVFIHGVFSNHEAWRFVAGDLGDDYNLVLVDLPGSGDSDRPDPRTLEPKGYAPDALAERLLQALEIHFSKRKSKPQITITAHSLGGLVAIRMLASTQLRELHEPILSCVERMVLLSPADIEIINPPSLFVEIAELTEEEIMLGDLTGILSEQICEGTLASVTDPSQALREEAYTRYEMLMQRDTRLALQAVFTQTVPMRNGRPDWDPIKRIAAEHKNVDIPCLIVWGARDETLPVAMGYKLTAQLPKAQLNVVSHCMHSVHLEDPALCAELIRSFMQQDTNSVAGDYLSNRFSYNSNSHVNTQ